MIGCEVIAFHRNGASQKENTGRNQQGNQNGPGQCGRGHFVLNYLCGLSPPHKKVPFYGSEFRPASGTLFGLPFLAGSSQRFIRSLHGSGTHYPFLVDLAKIKERIQNPSRGAVRVRHIKPAMIALFVGKRAIHIV